jgi:hypothetical protein
MRDKKTMAGLASRFHMMPSFNVRPCTEARTIVPKPESGHARVALKVIEGGSAVRWYQVDAAADCDFGCVFRDPAADPAKCAGLPSGTWARLWISRKQLPQHTREVAQAEEMKLRFAITAIGLLDWGLLWNRRGTSHEQA